MSLELKNLVVGYVKGITILNNVSFRAEENKVTCIIGPNGAGKSTILKTIYGFLKPQQGTIIFDGKEITGRKPCSLADEGLAFIPQRFAIFPQLTVRENLEMGAWVHRKDKTKVKGYLNNVYERFPILSERRNVLAKRLSGGEQRMLDLARAIIIKPKTILLDEPTVGLAPKIAENVYQTISLLVKEGITLLIVDQNIKKAVTMSDYVYVVKDGRITDEGSTGEFSEKLRSLIRAWLF